jgi:hypothetical protein
MAVVINGSGTVTGLAVGGLPDGTVDSDTLASGIDKTSISDSGDATAITIDSSENVGIGDTTPTNAKLSIDNVLSGDAALAIKQDQAYYGIDINQDGNGMAFHIDTAATTQPAIEVEANSLTTGKGMLISSNSADTSTRQLLRVTNDHASATATTNLYLDNDSTGLIADFHGSGGISHNGMKTVVFSFGISLNAATNFDIPIINSVNYYEIKAIIGYYPGSQYTTNIHGLYAYRSDVGIGRVHNFSDNSDSNSGSWSVSNPDTTTIRVTKNAGNSSAFSRGFVEVKYRDESL